MNHPNWYFKHFDKLFSRREGYDKEIEHIANIAQLEGKRVQEIGAGTGEHSIRILKRGVSYLQLVDFDYKSIELLAKTFCIYPNVTILCEDGFSESFNEKFDVIICMYSIVLLSVNNLQELNERLNVLLHRLNKGGHLIFEVIDYDVCKRIYEEGVQTKLYENEFDRVDVKAVYSKSRLYFIYSGKLDNEIIYYKASLVRLNRDDILNLLKLKEVHRFGFVSLDDFDRRLLIYVKK